MGKKYLGNLREQNLIKIQKWIYVRWFSHAFVGALRGTCLSRITSDFDIVFTTLERCIKVWIYFTFMRTLGHE